jgi:hypothetical protein
MAKFLRRLVTAGNWLPMGNRACAFREEDSRLLEDIGWAASLQSPGDFVVESHRAGGE